MTKSSTNSLNWISLSALLLAVAALVVSFFQINSIPRIAYVESNVLILEYSESKEARTELDAKIKEWQTNINTLNNELEALNTELVEKAESWSKSKREEHLGKMQQKQQELGRYNAAVNKKATELETELMDPVYTSINSRMKAFGKDRGYKIVFGTVQGGNILYGDEAVNVTWDFIKYLEGETE